MTWYRMLDAPEAPKAAIPVEKSEAQHWNSPARGYGIFATVNDFDGARQKNNLRAIRAWAVDIDEGTKQEQCARLNASPLVPSLIVETRRGYQAYWAAKAAKAEHWDAIVLKRLVPAFGADKNARDLCRILRVPGFLHLKDPASPFLCREVHRCEVAYTERQMVEAFKPATPSAEAVKETARRDYIETGGNSSGDFWDAVYDLDCEEGLRLLSCSPLVGGESYGFRRTGRGRLNLFVDKKGTSVFIDENKRIGSLSGGGPTLYNWLRWFGNPPRVCVEELKRLFPRLAEIDGAGK